MGFLAVAGVRNISNLINDDTFKSFQEVSPQFTLKDGSDFWRYLQIRSSLGSVMKQLPGDDNVLQSDFKRAKNKQSASTFYKITVNSMYGNSENLRLTWQRDLNVTLTRTRGQRSFPVQAGSQEKPEADLYTIRYFMVITLHLSAFIKRVH